MEIEAVAENIAKNTLKEPDIDKAIRFAVSYSEALSLIYGYDLEDILILVSKLDRRLLNGSIREIIELDTDKFNSNGTVYITKKRAMEYKKDNCKALLLVYDKGL